MLQLKICREKRIHHLSYKVRTWDISDFYEEEFFQTKKVIYLPFK